MAVGQQTTCSPALSVSVHLDDHIAYGTAAFNVGMCGCDLIERGHVVAVPQEQLKRGTRHGLGVIGTLGTILASS